MILPKGKKYKPTHVYDSIQSQAVTPFEDRGFQMRDGGGVHLRHLRSYSILCLHQNSVDSHLPDTETSYQFSSVQSLSRV